MRVYSSIAMSSLDARGDTLVPGLIDAHVHLYEPGCPVPAEYEERSVDELFAVTCRQFWHLASPRPVCTSSTSRPDRRSLGARRMGVFPRRG